MDTEAKGQLNKHTKQRWHRVITSLVLSLIVAVAVTTILLSVVYAASESRGPNYAGAVGTNAWLTPTGAVGSEEVNRASAAYGTAIVTGFWNTFGFAIPTGATVNGIVVEIKAYWASDPETALGVDVGKNETTLGTEKTVAITNTEAIYTFGSATDLWGLTWTAADINATSFAVRLRKSVLGNETEVFLNWIRVTVYYTPTWESYKEATHLTVWGTVANPYAAETTTQTVYMYGEGFAVSQLYHVGFYDPSAAPNKVASTDPTSTAGGALSTQYLLTTDPTAIAGTWHAVVYKDPNSPPTAYTLGDPNAVADDAFEVLVSAIPEFPTVITAIAVTGLCFGIYYWMRKRRLARDKA